jgi:hypothetical protein
MIALGVWLVVGVAVSAAALSRVYTDSNSNISIDPNPFGGSTPPALSGTDNAELGMDGLQSLTSGSYNVASGDDALFSDTTGEFKMWPAAITRST